jgi:pimeloyl-ACP methyl ester carboxylesterase
LADFFIHQKDLITPAYFENVTRPQKIRGTTQSFLTVLSRQFFHTLDDHLPRLARLDIPVLIAWGREDNAIPFQKGEEMHRILSGSHFEILENAGHVPNFECARAFNEIVIDFLR